MRVRFLLVAALSLSFSVFVAPAFPADSRTPRSNDEWSRPTNLVPGLSEVHMKGYFGDDTRFFATAPLLKVSRTGSQLPDWNPSSVIGEYESVWWGGFFIPDETGNWDFQMTSDDASYMWLGKSAVSEYFYGPGSATLALPGLRGASSTSASVYLEKNKIYPLRIQYGNAMQASWFKFEIKPPSFKKFWDKNLEGLIWSAAFSDKEDCTNYGISYTLAKQLGLVTLDVAACKNNPANSNFSFAYSTPSTKPSTPTFSGVSFVGNKINIKVNIGSSSSTRPERIYLVSPKLGIDTSNPVEGKISGETASWSLPLGKILSGVAIPLEIVGVKNGVKSEPLVGSYTTPSMSITSVPPAPTNYSFRIVGTSAIISVQVSTKSNSRASSVYLLSPSLGIKKGSELEGDVVGSKAVIEVPLKSSMEGKKYPLTIFLKNSKGDSKPLNATLTIPKSPKAPTLPTARPSTSALSTVVCIRANQTRTFEGVQCPLGWEKR
jgi:hypothetical protein